jgi:hypothetical protein
MAKDPVSVFAGHLLRDLDTIKNGPGSNRIRTKPFGVNCPKTAASTFDTTHAALNYSLCGGHYNHCVIFSVFLRVICVCILEYAIHSGSNILAYSTYSSDADIDNA